MVKKDTLKDKILRLQKEFDQPIVVSFSCNENQEISIEMCLPRIRWDDDGDDGDGEMTPLPERDYSIASMQNYIG